MTSDLPLVTCIMPTHDRRRFVPRAIDYFLRQDYPNRELVIVDDGSDRVRDLVPESDAIIYHAIDRRLTTGEKRNLAVELGRGEIVMHWDDDDWMHPARIGYQVGEMLAAGADICGTSSVLFYDIRMDRLWLYRYPAQAQRWLCGGTLCYRRELWKAKQFQRVNIGEDTRFVWARPVGRMLDLPDIKQYIAMVHPGNTSRKSLVGSRWLAWHGESAGEIMGEDASFYTGMLPASAIAAG